MRWIFRLRVADPTAAGDSLFTALIKKPPYPFTQEDIVERTLNGVLPFVTLTHATPGALLQGAYTQLPLPGAPLAIDGTIAMTLTLGTPVAALSVFNISIDFSHTLSS